MTREEKIDIVTQELAQAGYQSLWSFVDEYLTDDDLNGRVEIYDEDDDL
jgi:hypothetical protein